MDHFGSRSLFTRSSEQNIYKSAIRNETQIDSKITSLIDLVFQHHPACYGETEPPQHDNGDHLEEELSEDELEKIPSREWISWQFYHQHYCEVEVTKDFDGASMPSSNLFHEVTEFRSPTTRNDLYFLVGDVGSGKTALINQTISTILPTMQREKDFWFLRYNVHVLNNQKLTLSRLLRGASKKLTRLIDRFPQQLDLEPTQIRLLATYREILLSLDDETDLNTCRARFVQCVKGISATIGKRPLIIFDNLDSFFHVKDRYIFVRKEDTGEMSEISDILSIVDEFYHGQSELGDIGANVLFVARPDTYDILAASKAVYQGTENCFTGNRHLFTLKAPDWQMVVEKRLGLLDDVLKSIRSEGFRNHARNSLSAVVNELENVSTGSGELLRQLRQLTNFGLRDILDFISDYTWLPSTSAQGEADITMRYIEHYPVGLMAFILKNKKLYSQKRSKFPNIFACNVSEEEGRHIEDIAPTKFNDASVNLAEVRKSLQENSSMSEEEIDKLIALSEIGIKASKQVWSLHGHSYWIRYLLLNFIRHRNDRNMSVKFGDVTDVFCGPLGSDSFSNRYVRAMLGTLSEHDEANLIQVKRALSADKSSIQNSEILVTPRAIQCLNDLFDKFFYLQLVIDDPELPLPRTCERAFSNAQQFNYSYLAAEGHDYGVNTRKMVAHKARLTLKFLAILDNSLEVERIRYSDAFNRLEDEAVPLPQKGEMLGSVLRQFSALSRSMRGSGMEILRRSEAQSVYDQYLDKTRDEIEKAHGLA